MTTAHTPGPWPLITVPTVVGSCHRIGQFPSRFNGDSIAACIYADGIRPGVDDLLPRAQTLLANARLIASAPELLVMLEECAVHIAAIRGDSDPYAIRAFALISKATGSAT